MRALYRFVWIGSLLAILGMSYRFLTQPPTMPVLGPMTAYVSNDKSLSLEYPNNWKPRSAGSHAVAARVAFDPNLNTHYAIDTSLVGSLLSDIAKSPGGADLSALPGLPGVPTVASDKQKSPLELAHEAALQAMEKNKTRYPDFEPGETKPIQIGGLAALHTTFTFQQPGVWGKRDMIGAYSTALDRDREVSVTATCSKELQKTMLPLFDGMTASIHLGQTGG